MTEPLVSVVVITYNSAAWLTETLDSIHAQSYPNIELVISDDHSTDDTLAVAERWLQTYGSRFANCVLRAGEQNMGITKNANAGVRCSTGYYVKLLAGDDLLMPEAIRINVEGCQDLNSRYLFTWLQKFSQGERGRRYTLEAPPLEFFRADASEQYRMLLRENRVYGPLFFCERSFLEEMGLYDERYEWLEDHPLWLKMTGAGYRLVFQNVQTVNYRVSPSSVTQGSGKVVNERFFDCTWKFYRECRRPELRRLRRFGDLLINTRRWFYPWLIIRLGNDASKPAVRLVQFFYLRKYLSGRR